MTPDTEIAIVLTAAIIVSSGADAVAEAAVRREQYLTALRYYARFAPVYFLENSGYDLWGDTAFTGLANVRLRQIPAHENEGRGKGYREFHSLDTWYETEKERPRRIVKITGRYLFANIRELLAECRAAAPDLLLFDRNHDDRIAVTSLFSLSWENYGRYLRGLYREVNDPQGIWIEHVVYRVLAEHRAKCRFFSHEPDIGGVSGSSGREMRTSRSKFLLKQAARSMNRLFDGKFLYWRGTALDRIKKMMR
jgi:hypothetical protein